MWLKLTYMVHNTKDNDTSNCLTPSPFGHVGGGLLAGSTMCMKNCMRKMSANLMIKLYLYTQAGYDKINPCRMCDMAVGFSRQSSLSVCDWLGKRSMV